jgi:IS30 family transposase
MSAQITLRERYAISILKQRGLSIRAIARTLSRSPSTISRELARNRTRHDGSYRYERAGDATPVPVVSESQVPVQWPTSTYRRPRLIGVGAF